MSDLLKRLTRMEHEENFIYYLLDEWPEIKAALAQREGMEPIAWLYQCRRGGHYSEYASVDSDDKQWWPTDQWKEVKRTPLCECGPAEVLFSAAPSARGEKEDKG